jgi:hypothetical protein
MDCWRMVVVGCWACLACILNDFDDGCLDSRADYYAPGIIDITKCPMRTVMIKREASRGN